MFLSYGSSFQTNDFVVFHCQNKKYLFLKKITFICKVTNFAFLKKYFSFWKNNILVLIKILICIICSFFMFIYVLFNNFSVMSGRFLVFMG